MQHAAKAYSSAGVHVASQRELEANLLLKAASRLQAVQDGRANNQADLHSALQFNHKLWTIFLNSATNASNPLPAETRQNIANLGIFVFKQTMSTMTDNRLDRLNSLISINRELAAGLRGVG